MADETDPLVRAQHLSAMGAGKSTSIIDGGRALESCVTIEFETAALPSSVVKAGRLVAILSERLQLRLDKDVLAFVREMSDFENVSLEELDDRIPVPIGLRNGAVQFDQGGKRKTVLIDFVQFVGRGDTLRVSVYSDSDDAEFVLGKVYESMWEAAGEKRQWADGKREVHAKGFTTSTHESLDCSPERLFSPGVREFCRELADPTGIGARIGVHQVDPSTGQPEVTQSHVAVKFRRLQLGVTLVDLKSGKTWDSYISVSPKTKTTLGRGLYQVMSELPFQEHRKLAALLQKALGGEALTKR